MTKVGTGPQGECNTYCYRHYRERNLDLREAESKDLTETVVYGPLITGVRCHNTRAC